MRLLLLNISFEIVNQPRYTISRSSLCSFPPPKKAVKVVYFKKMIFEMEIGIKAWKII